MVFRNLLLEESFGRVFDWLAIDPYDALPVVLHMLFAATVVAVFAVAISSRTELVASGKKHALPILAILVFGALFHALVAEHEFRYFEDEPWAVEQAKIFVTGQPYSWFPFQHSVGWPFFLGLAFRIFGISASTALYLADSFGVVSLALLYLVAVKISGSRSTAMYATLLLGLTTVHVFWSATASSMVPGLCVFLFAFLVVLHCLSERRGVWWLVLGVLVVGWTVLTRIETVLFVPIAGVLYWICRRRDAMTRDWIALWSASALVAILSFPSIYLAANFYLGENTWLVFNKTPELGIFSGDYLSNNIVANLNWLRFDLRRPPALHQAILAGGILYAVYRRDTPHTIALVWTLATFILYEAYFVFTERWLVFVLAAACVLGGSALSALHGKLSRLPSALVALLLASPIALSQWNIREILHTNLAKSPFEGYIELADKLKDAFPDPDTVFVFHHPLRLSMLLDREVISTRAYLEKGDLSERKHVFISVLSYGLLHRLSVEKEESSRPEWFRRYDFTLREEIKNAREIRPRLDEANVTTLSVDFTLRSDFPQKLVEILRFRLLQRDGDLLRVRRWFECYPIVE